MKFVVTASIALVFIASVAIAGEAVYQPLPNSAVQVAPGQTVEPCPSDREMMACVVELSQKTRWSYYLVDDSGAPSSQVRLYKPTKLGDACAAMAYPKDNVKTVGGPGEWFKGTVDVACRRGT